MVLVCSLTACSKEPSDSETDLPADDPTVTDPVPQEQPDLEKLLSETGAYLQNSVADPTFGSVGGEWLVMGLARSGLDISGEYFEKYFENLSAYTARQGGVLHAKKYTEYSRVVLAVTAIGRDPSDVGGFDLLQPLADFDQTVFQGINGPIFALLALDSGSYEIPENTADGTQASRNLYVDYIVNAQLTEGGWSLTGGEAEVDLTAMALQALTKYRDRMDVEQAVEKGLTVLSRLQNETGGYAAYGEESSESVAQTMVALTELGISLEDSRFVKNGNTLLDALLRFRQADGGFSHLPDGESDLLATEQAFYAMVSLRRQSQDQTSLYTMR